MLNFKAKETKTFFRILVQIDLQKEISKDPFKYARFSMFR